MATRITWTSSTVAEDDGGSLETADTLHVLEFDAVARIGHTNSAFVTEKAVEGDVAITDHKRPERDTITIEAIVSNTPIDSPPPSGYTQGDNPTGSILPGDNGAVLQFSATFDRVADVAYTLRRLAREPTLVTLVTSRRTYEQMAVVAVEDAQVSRDHTRFTIDLAEVRVAETSLVDSPLPREPRGGRRGSEGAQEGADAEEGNGTRTNQSLAEEVRERVDNGEDFTDAAAAALGFGGS